MTFTPEKDLANHVRFIAERGRFERCVCGARVQPESRADAYCPHRSARMADRRVFEAGED